jgi:ABC-type arginine/histidine transport system permease subunit
MPNNNTPSMLATVVQLVIWSVVVGVVPALNLFERLGLIARRISDLSFGAVHWGLQYFVLGTDIVVPVWLDMRVMRERGHR